MKGNQFTCLCILFLLVLLSACDIPFSERPILDNARFEQEKLKIALDELDKTKNLDLNQKKLKLKLLFTLEEHDAFISYFEEEYLSNIWKQQEGILYLKSLSQTGDWDKIEKFLARNPGLSQNQEVILLKAAIALRDEDYAKAIVYLDNISKTSEQSFRYRIEAYMGLKKFDEAFDMIAKSPGQGIKREDSLKLFFQYFDHKKLFTKVDSLLQVAIEISSEKESWFALGTQWYDNRQSFSRLLVWNDKKLAADLQSKDQWTWKKAEIFDKMGFSDSTIFYTGQLLKSDFEKRDEAILLNAKWLDRKGNFYGAINRYNEYLEIHPENEFAEAQIVILRRKIAYLREREEQKQLFENLPSLMPLKSNNN